VVGSCLASVLKSYESNVPIIMPSHVPPTIDMNLSSEVRVGELITSSHSEVWSMLKFLCGMKGLIINPDSLEYIKVHEDGVRFRGTDVKFTKCHLFSDPVVKNDLEVISIENEDAYKIIDFMRLKFCDASNLDPISVKDSFISKICSTGKKEIFAVSLLSREDLTDFDYSDTMVKFIAQKMLESDSGVHRPLIHKGSPSRRIPKLEVIERTVTPLREVVYKSTRRVKFYGRKKRDNIIKTYCRNNPSI